MAFKQIISFLNGFRKFSVMVLLIVIGITFRLTGYLSGSEMVELLRFTGVAFMSANGIEHMMKATQEWVKGKMRKEVEEAKNGAK